MERRDGTGRPPGVVNGRDDAALGAERVGEEREGVGVALRCDRGSASRSASETSFLVLFFLLFFLEVERAFSADEGIAVTGTSTAGGGIAPGSAAGALCRSVMIAWATRYEMPSGVTMPLGLERAVSCEPASVNAKHMSVTQSCSGNHASSIGTG